MDTIFSNLKDLITLDHGPNQPSTNHLIYMVVVLGVSFTICTLYLQLISLNNTKKLIQSVGVSLKKITRTAKEIERKTFHMTGLLVPLSYQILMKYYNWSQNDFSKFAWICTLIIWVGDIFRVLVPSCTNYFPFSILDKIIREKERKQLSGICYFSLGCTITISIFPPAVAIISIIYLVLGDMSAALFGISFGGDICVVKMGREGNKSMEGSVAMFIVCCIIGLIAFKEVYLSEYAIILSSLIATVVELYEPFGLNDNLTIPCASALTLQWALKRIETC